MSNSSDMNNTTVAVTLNSLASADLMKVATLNNYNNVGHLYLKKSVTVNIQNITKPWIYLVITIEIEKICKCSSVMYC